MIYWLWVNLYFTKHLLESLYSIGISGISGNLGLCFVLIILRKFLLPMTTIDCFIKTYNNEVRIGGATTRKYNLPLANQLRYCDARTYIDNFNRRECKWQTLVAAFQKNWDSYIFHLHILHIYLRQWLIYESLVMKKHIWDSVIVTASSKNEDSVALFTQYELPWYDGGCIITIIWP